MRNQELLERFFSAVVAEGIHPRPGSLRFYLDFLFDSLPLEGKALLDIGAGDGTIGFYARCAGAESVHCLEPVLAGSRPGMHESFRRMQARLGVSNVRLEPTTLQEFDPRGRTFDVLLLHDSINHLDEEACIALRREDAAAARYAALFDKMSRLSRSGATLIATDCSRHNVFNMLGLTNPILPRIEWHKHQSPEVWAAHLSRVGFGGAGIRWRSPSILRGPGRALLGNRVASFCIDSQFCLTMVRSQGAPGRVVR